MLKMPDIIEASGGPITLVFSPDGRAFFSERITGNLWEILGEKDFRLVCHFPVIQITGHHETGLLGITLDPEFTINHFIYAFYTYGEALNNTKSRVIRLNAETDQQKVLIEDLPAGEIHNGGVMAVGPDGKLYIGVGVSNEIMKKAQDLSFLGGKILRLNLDGSIPEDNPFPNSPVYSYGHRNIFGLSFDPKSGILYACDVGPEKNDEINIIEAGGNYGWPEVTGVVKDSRFIDPIQTYTPTITPTQSVFVDGFLYFGSYNEGTVHRLTFDKTGRKITKDEVVYRGKPFGVVGVFVSPENEFFVTTLDRIIKFEPEVN